MIKYNQKIYIDIIKDISQCDAINTNMYRDMMAYLYLYKNDLLKKSENSIADTEAKNNVEDSQKTLHMTHLVNIVRNALVEYKSDHSYEDLINFPFDEKENKRNDIALGLRFFHFIPPQVYASLVSKEMDMSFDEVWNDIKDKHYPYFSNIEESEKKNEQIAAELAEREKNQEEREKTFNLTQKKYDDKEVNIEQIANNLNGMRPQAAVDILVAMDDQVVIDVLRKVEEMAKENGSSSMGSYWLSLMPSDRAAEIQRKMISKPESLD